MMAAGDLIISENMMLRSLKGLERLQSIGGDLIMNSNMNLLSVDGLQVCAHMRSHMRACLRLQARVCCNWLVLHVHR